jgi:hypothetical protein
MTPLLKDYLRRNWWGFLLVLFAPLDALSDTTSFAGFSAVIGPALLMWHRRNGALDTWRTLPVHRRETTWTLWGGTVLLWPGAYFIAATGCAAIAAITTGAAFPLVSIAFSSGLACAWAAALVFVLLLAPDNIDAPQGMADQIRATVFGAMWGLSLGAGMGGPVVLEAYDIPTPLVTLIGLVAFVPLSYFAIRGMVTPRGRSHAVANTPAAPSPVPAHSNTPWTGVGTEVARMSLYAFGYGLLALCVVLFMGSMRPNTGPSAARFAHTGLVVYLALPLYACFQWPPALRALRALPLPTTTLTLSLLIIPAAVGFVVITTMTMMAAYLWDIPLTNFLPQIVLLTGLALTVLAIGMRFGLWGLMVCLWIVMGTWPVLNLATAPTSAILLLAILFALGGGIANYKLIRHSSHVYRQRWAFFRPKSSH